MKYSFINLNDSIDRKEFVFENFRKYSHREKNIIRVEAVDTNYVNEYKVAGKLKPNEKACYLSHCKAIELSMKHDDHVFIAEDDVLFCERSTKVIEKVIDSLNPASWDILYTDLCFPNADSMLSLFLKRRQFDKDGKLQLLNLSNIRFCGATAYIINKSSKQKVLDLLSKTEINLAGDIVFRHAIHSKKLKGFALFPFVTSLSQYAENSQIQAGDDLVPDLLFNAYRRLVWLGRDVKVALSTIDRIDNDIYNEDSDAFCGLFRAMLSTKIKTK